MGASSSPLAEGIPNMVRPRGQAAPLAWAPWGVHGTWAGGAQQPSRPQGKTLLPGSPGHFSLFLHSLLSKLFVVVVVFSLDFSQRRANPASIRQHPTLTQSPAPSKAPALRSCVSRGRRDGKGRVPWLELASLGIPPRRAPGPLRGPLGTPRRVEKLWRPGPWSHPESPSPETLTHPAAQALGIC